LYYTNIYLKSKVILKGGTLFLFSRTAMTIMKWLQIVLQICVLYAFTFTGDVIQRAFHIPIPGSIIGLLLLLACLLLHIVPVIFVKDGASFLLSILPLLFIPSMAGVVNYPSLLSATGAVLAAIVVVSTIATIAAAGLMSQFLENRADKRKEKRACKALSSQS
jgi:holin-like protein